VAALLVRSISNAGDADGLCKLGHLLRLRRLLVKGLEFGVQLRLDL